MMDMSSNKFLFIIFSYKKTNATHQDDFHIYISIAKHNYVRLYNYKLNTTA